MMLLSDGGAGVGFFGNSGAGLGMEKHCAIMMKVRPI